MMSGRKKAVIFLLLLSPFIGFCQQPDTLIKKLDSLEKKTDSAGGQVNNINQKAYNEKTNINFKTYFILLGSDFKQQFTAPFHATKKDWINAGIFTAGAIGLGFVDEPVQRTALRLRQNNKSLQNVSRYVTNFGGLYEAYTLAALGSYGFIFKKDKIKTTTLLATQAYLTTGALENVFKLLSGRQRPSYYDPNAVEQEPKFHGPFYKFVSDTGGQRTNSSFPSGHTAVAFAAATVFAMEYKDRPLIPIIAYSAASLIGVSRITENKHWMTDVLVGAVLGLLSGRQVVNNYHRYAKIKDPKIKKNTVSFNLQYNFGRMMPGLVYHIR
jgi:membrane-associated phospholipid phosphatase